MDKPALHMIGGPTASGKTAAALELARRVGGVIINADAMQVYAGLPLLTAQPTDEEKQSFPHKLFEIFDPSERSSAGRWLALAKEAIADAVGQGRTPIMVGGTGLYFGALMGNLADIPPIPDQLRTQATVLYDEIGHDAFRVKLAALDAQSAARIMPNDRQRLIRAYEVVVHTGKALGAWQQEGEAESVAKDFTIQRHLLMPDRAKLYAACDARFLKMIECGALDEVRRLLSRCGEERTGMRHCAASLEAAAIHAAFTRERVLPQSKDGSSRLASESRDDAKTKTLSPDLPAMKILGVPELAAHLRGETSLQEAIAKAQQATRNYAKRQMTWFRNQWGGG